jgi:acetyltransferase-like isoleucine patch superfamily enzyme
VNLDKLRHLRRLIVRGKIELLRRVYGMDIHPTVEISLSAKFDRRNPRGIHIGEETYVALDAMILTHDRTRGVYADTIVERHCFLGARCLILPGVRIGEGSIVGAGSVVTQDVPPRSIVVGNPAEILRRDVNTRAYGRIYNDDGTPYRAKLARSRAV